ncbi:YafY family protein [Amycolatopsis sp. PS_44_ISF1]|uniref:helix-turn-helix transcriptional regulator n=1 Tax=Amycolatopsis sp. PS_44_ISF1 TaxID=2974917 RepID=UPI0028DEFFE7|nr:YafY family protein [Amycolatopsis sp. PS_44_ISF1]MDT8914345.1 YafY family transcriptional regulator [Amycolatopsis sp. PS_44_ISF1]
MTRPTARVLALLEILQSGGTRTAAELAERLGVDERTVRRYAEHLTDLDVPVRSVRGRYGGYRLAPGFRMPPLMLTDDEAVAVLLGLVAAGRDRLVPAPATAVESATAKIRRVLPGKLGRRLDALLATAEFTGSGTTSSGTTAEPSAAAAEATTTGPAAPPGPETGVLLTLAEAARARRPVAFAYTAWGGRRSERTVHPYGIVAHSGRWYVTGADSASGEVRTFRLDRIGAATVLAGEFEVPAGFDPGERVLSGLAEVPYRHEVSLQVHGAAEDVRARFPAGIATVRGIPAAAGWVRVRLRAERLDWIPGVLARLDHPFVIEQPDELRDHVHALARRLAENADARPPRDQDS